LFYLTLFDSVLAFYQNFCLDSIGQWSGWSEWSGKRFKFSIVIVFFYFKECYPSCGVAGSTQTRRRTCLDNKCFGKTIEKRDCSFCPSQLKTNWSCWTEWSECSLCTSTRSYSTKFRTRLCLINPCVGSSREERSCSCPLLLPFLNEYRFTLLHLILISLISFFLGCLLILCIYALYHHHHRYRLQRTDQEYSQGSTSNSSSSPHTAIDSDMFTTLTNPTNKFRNFDSSSISRTGPKNSFKDIPSRKLNMYINPRDVLPSPPPATLKRTSLMSSMKTNLDADDL
jgi:hypothetical protein